MPLKRETLIGVLEEHKQEYSFPENYWESTLFEALSEAVDLIKSISEDNMDK